MFESSWMSKLVSLEPKHFTARWDSYNAFQKSLFQNPNNSVAQRHLKHRKSLQSGSRNLRIPSISNIPTFQTPRDLAPKVRQGTNTQKKKKPRVDQKKPIIQKQNGTNKPGTLISKDN